MSAAISAIQKLTSKFRRTLSVMAVLALAFNPMMPLVSLVPVQAASTPAVANQSTGENFTNLQDAIDDSNTSNGDIIEMNEDLTTTEQVTVDKELTIDGNNFTLTADFIKTTNDNNSALGVQANNVVISELSVIGQQNPASSDLHGINVFNSTNVVVKDVSSSNFRSGLLYVSSTGTIRNITTSGNIWHAINVDRSSDSSLPGSNVTIEGENSHAENSPDPTNDFIDGSTVPHLFQDDATDSEITINDADNQYFLNEVSFRGNIALLGTLNAGPSRAETTEEVVTQMTAPGYDQEGWWINRDVDNATPIEFTEGEASIGDGSIYVLPLAGTSNPDAKFIGEYFVLDEMRNIESISYNFMIGSGGDSSDANEFYMNVYANFPGNTSDYYNCKYDVVPEIGSTSNWTTVTFNPAEAITSTGNVTGTNCPDRPLAMGAKATIRAVAINLGDSSDNDAGLDGYFDNVVLTKATTQTTFDFEVIGQPQGLTVTQDGVDFGCNGVTNQRDITRSWNDVNGAFSYNYQLTDNIAEGVDHDRTSTDSEFSGTLRNNDATYSFRVQAVNSNGDVSEWSEWCGVTLDREAPVSAPTITNPGSRTWHRSTPIVNSWTSVTDQSGIDYYQVAYRYDDGHTFSNSTCPGEEINGETLSGCRNTSNTSRNHTPAASEQMGVTLWVRAVDNAGNIGSWSESVHYYYDSTNPATNIVVGGFEDNANRLTDHEFTVGGTATDNLSLNRVYIQLVNRQDNKRYGGATIHLIGEGASSNWSKTYNANVMNLPDGDYAAHVSVVDRAGNTASAGWTDDFTVDGSAPSVPSNLSPGDGAALNSSDLFVDWSESTDNFTDQNDISYEYRLFLDEIDANNYEDSSDDSRFEEDYTGSTRHPSSGFAPGTPEDTYFWKIRACDQAGNCSDWSSVWEFTIDNTAPILSGLTAIENENDTVTLTVEDDGTANAVTFTVGGEVFGDDADEDVVEDPDGTWTATVGPLAPGTYTIVANATDASGNETDDGPDTEITLEDNLVGVGDPEAALSDNDEQQDDDAVPAGNETGPVEFAAITAGEQFAQAAVPDADDDDQVEVLGVQDSDEDGDTLQATSDQPDDADDAANGENDGLPVWWWLLILAAILGSLWLIIARRGGNDE